MRWVSEGSRHHDVEDLIRILDSFVPDSAEDYENFDFAAVFERAQDRLDKLNRFFSQREPWNIVTELQETQDPEKLKELRHTLEETLYLALEGGRIISLGLSPCIPNLMGRIQTRIGVAPEEQTWDFAKFVSVSSSFTSLFRLSLFGHPFIPRFLFFPSVPLCRVGAVSPYTPNLTYSAKAHRLSIPNFKDTYLS